MKHVVGAAFIFIVMALIGHGVTVHMIPVIIMNKAIDKMEDRGVKLHEFSLAQRTTPQTQSVVRPSPDLAYSICRFDLSGDALLKVNAGIYDDYSSVSFFDMRTNNFATVRVGAGGFPSSGSQILLRAPGSAPIGDTQFAGPQFETPTKRGLILIRRLAPTQQAYDEVARIAQQDRCAFIADGHL